MKHLKLITISALPIMWTIYFLFELLTGRINSTAVLLGNIFLVVLFAFVGFLLYEVSLKFKTGFSSKNFLWIFALLMIFDQGLKIIINKFFFEKEFSIVDEFLSFNPIINTNGSWINARFNTNLSFTFLILTNILALALFIEVYRYFLSKSHKSFWEDTCFLFIFCGALCSLIDKVFYGGSLDFIGIGNLFVADIKDIYIDIGMLLFIVSIYQGGYLASSEDNSLKEDFESIKHFLKFIKKDFSSLIKKR